MVPATGPDESRVLRYQIVKDLVLTLIAEQSMEPGDRLPSSTALAAMAGVSQISVRRALDELERAGLIQRHQGVGTFVAIPSPTSGRPRSGALLAPLDDDGDTEQIATEVLHLRVALPGPAIASALLIEEGQPVWEVARRRLLSDTPIILERAVLPLSLVPSLDDGLLSDGGSLSTYLREKFGLVPVFEEQSLVVRSPSPQERDDLRLRGRERVIAVRGVSTDVQGRTFEAFEQVYPLLSGGLYMSGYGRFRPIRERTSPDWSVVEMPTR